MSTARQQEHACSSAAALLAHCPSCVHDTMSMWAPASIPWPIPQFQGHHAPLAITRDESRISISNNYPSASRGTRAELRYTGHGGDGCATVKSVFHQNAKRGMHIRRGEVESTLRRKTARRRVGRSGVPTQLDGGVAGAGESVGRVTRVGSRGVDGGREGRSVGHPVSRLSRRGGAVGRKFHANCIKKESVLLSRCPLESDTTLMQNKNR